MSGGNLAHGQSSYVGTISAVGTSESTTFADRYGFVLVTNESTVSPLYVTGDGSTPEASGAGTTVVVNPEFTTCTTSNGQWYSTDQRVLYDGGVNG